MSHTRTTRARTRAQSNQVDHHGTPPTTNANVAPQATQRSLSPDAEDAEAERALRGGQSPLTDLSERRSPRSPQRSSQRDDVTQSPNDQEEAINELTNLVETAQGRIGDMREEIDGAIERGLELTARYQRMRQDMARDQEQFTATLSNIRQRLNRARMQAGRKKTSDDGGVSYADPDDPLEWSRNHLFRPRDDEENTEEYQHRENAQRRLLAREHYEDGTRQRNHDAILWWRAREALELRNEAPTDQALRREYERQAASEQRRAAGSPDDGDDPSTTETPSDGQGRGDRQPPSRRNNSRRNSESTSHGRSGGQGRGRGGAPGAPGGPPGGGSSGGGRSPSRQSSRPSEPQQGARTRPRVAQAIDRQRRSPTYLDDQVQQSQPHDPSMLANPHAGHVQQQLDIIRAEIRTRLRTDLPDTPGLKNLKGIPAPGKYDGRDDSEEFMTWLKGLLRWLVLNRLGAQALDDLRVDLLGQYVEGAARDWYDDIVDNVFGSGRGWTFEQTICELYVRFIHKSTARSAAEKFYGARYKKESGVSGLWDYIRKNLP